MAKKEKYELETKLVFPKDFDYEDFLKEFAFTPYVYNISDDLSNELVEKDGLFGMMFSNQQLKQFKDLKIQMHINATNINATPVIMICKGQKSMIKALEFYLDRCYEQNKFVTMNYSDDTGEDSKVDTRFWDNEQVYRLRLYESGKSVEEISEIIAKDKKDKDEEEWENTIYDKLREFYNKQKMSEKQEYLKAKLKELKILREKIAKTRNEINELQNENKKNKVKTK